MFSVRNSENMRIAKNILIMIGLAWILFPAALSAQATPASKTQTGTGTTIYSLYVEKDDGKKTILGLADIAKIKRLTVKANDHGKEASFEGYPLFEVLKLAGIEFGETLRGKRLATFLLVEAADKYQVVFALPEIDPGFTDKIIILADKRDGKPLSKAEGDLRLVVPDEKRGGRWVRQVIGFKIMRAGN